MRTDTEADRPEAREARLLPITLALMCGCVARVPAGPDLAPYFYDTEMLPG